MSIEGSCLPLPREFGRFGERCDRSPARSAWDSPPQKEPSRRVRCDSRRCVDRFDDWGDYPFLRKTAHISTRITSGTRSAPDHTVPYGTVPLGWGCSRHFVPGYDRPVPPGLSPFVGALKLQTFQAPRPRPAILGAPSGLLTSERASQGIPDIREMSKLQGGRDSHRCPKQSPN